VAPMPRSMPASDLERSKDASSLAGAPASECCVLVARGATVGGWWKSARHSGSSDGLRVSVI